MWFYKWQTERMRKNRCGTDFTKKDKSIGILSELLCNKYSTMEFLQQQFVAEVYGRAFSPRNGDWRTVFLLTSAETRTLPRSSSMAAGLERNGRTRVQAIFSHAAGDNSTLLSFSENDVITLLVPEARDGWHYGENEKTRMWVQLLFAFFKDSSDSISTFVSLSVWNLNKTHHSSKMTQQITVTFYGE